jgi:hypothetical protein
LPALIVGDAVSGNRSSPAVRWSAIKALLAGLLAMAVPYVVRADAATEIGRVIYQRGLLPSGAPLRTQASSRSRIEGRDAACVNCHRRSALGSIEGLVTIPPIAGAYLYAPHATSLESLGVPFVDTERVEHQPYDDEILARTLRGGVGSDGRVLNDLMPRYQLDDGAMAALIAYLKSIKVSAPPGVQSRVLHFATIITPDADPVARQGMLDVLKQYFADKNSAVGRIRAPTMMSSHRTGFRVERTWQLHVWTLTGPASGWEEQLRRHYAAEPVFAVISGIAGGDWAPVHRFCQDAQVPCLFPNVDLPPGGDNDFYSIYFDRGVLLEADLMASRLQATGLPKRVIQIYRGDDVGAGAAKALRARLERDKVEVVDQPLAHGVARSALERAIHAVSADAALVMWLRPDDVSALTAYKPPHAHSIWLSGEMSGLERTPLPPAWRPVTQLTFPVDLPDQRVVRVDYALAWFRLRHLAVVAPRVQVDTYLACGILSETLNHMFDAFVRDYLLERVEMQLDHRLMTGYYPRLTLAPLQRYASKGGYIVRFQTPSGTAVKALTDWVTP